MGVKLGLSHTKERTQIEGVWEQGPEKNIWTQEGGSGEEVYIVRSFITCTFQMIKSSRIRWVWHTVCMGEMRNAYKIVVGKPERKRPLWKI